MALSIFSTHGDFISWFSRLEGVLARPTWNAASVLFPSGRQELLFESCGQRHVGAPGVADRCATTGPSSRF